jgi:hypothetical protein
MLKLLGEKEWGAAVFQARKGMIYWPGLHASQNASTAQIKAAKRFFSIAGCLYLGKKMSYTGIFP